MAALHEALKSLGPCDFSDIPTEDLQALLADAFSDGKTIVDSVPIPPPAALSITIEGRPRSVSSASSASEISASVARSAPAPAEIEALQKEWKPVKLNPRDNPLGMSVYKMGGKDGKGSWFARRSVHEGLGFRKWKKAMEREFPETMKVQGGPGEGNIRGIGGETRVEYRNIEGVGKLAVYLLSAQFPGPTAPRDFVTMFLTSDQALTGVNGDEAPRHFMVISKPCLHPEAPPRDGYIRGQYESVEFIREIPLNKKPTKSASTTQLDKGYNRNRSSTLGKEAILRNAVKTQTSAMSASDEQPEGAFLSAPPVEGGRARGRTISFDTSRGSEAKGEDLDIPREEECETNPIEWIMITRSDPGGSVPRFLIDRGTPGGIVNDASKFLDWACGMDIEDLDDDDEALPRDVDEVSLRPHRHDTDLHNFQTNGHLAGLEEEPDVPAEAESSPPPREAASLHSTPAIREETPVHTPPAISQQSSNGGLYGMVAVGFGVASEFIASHTPQIISDRFSLDAPNGRDSFHENINSYTYTRRDSISTISTVSSVNSFTSALENRITSRSIDASNASTADTEKAAEIEVSYSESSVTKSSSQNGTVNGGLKVMRTKDLNQQNEEAAKEEGLRRKADERRLKEARKADEKARKEALKQQQKKEKEAKKADDKRRKAIEKDERLRLAREVETLQAEITLLKRDAELLKSQVGDLQAENTMLAAKVGRLGGRGEDVLRDVREELERGKSSSNSGSRSRSSSLKAMQRPLALHMKSSSILGGLSLNSESKIAREKEKENSAPTAPAAPASNVLPNPGFVRSH